MTTSNKLAQERADRAKSLQCPSATLGSSDQPQHNQTLINFFYGLLDARCFQLITRGSCPLPWLYFGDLAGASCCWQAHVLPSCELAKTEGAQQTGPGKSGLLPLAAAGDSVNCPAVLIALGSVSQQKMKSSHTAPLMSQKIEEAVKTPSLLHN